ncbi:ISL3 family transposase, partial [Fredinandcohnia sp. QZ13]|nr:ISL3 family transposase [Fredinandcohnia sp. QZ13]
MDFTMIIPGLKGSILTNVEEVGEVVRLYVEMERKVNRCPKCNQRTN